MAQDYKNLSAPSTNVTEELLSLNSIIEKQLKDHQSEGISNQLAGDTKSSQFY